MSIVNEIFEGETNYDETKRCRPRTKECNANDRTSQGKFFV